MRIVVLSGTQAFKPGDAQGNHSSQAGSSNAHMDSMASNEKRRYDDVGSGSGDEQEAGRSIPDDMNEKVQFSIGAPGAKPAKMRRRQ